MRKGGAGKSNWGTYKDDAREETKEEDNEQKVEEEVDDSLTLSELMKKQ